MTEDQQFMTLAIQQAEFAASLEKYRWAPC